jgi:hypothetical protein
MKFGTVKRRGHTQCHFNGSFNEKTFKHGDGANI